MGRKEGGPRKTESGGEKYSGLCCQKNERGKIKKENFAGQSKRAVVRDGIKLPV